MADEGTSHPLIFIRGEERDYLFIYGPRDLTLPRFIITGQSVSMKIKPHGASEIVYTDVNPGIRVSNGAVGEITVNPTGAMKTAYEFQNAPYVILLNGKRLFYGTVTVRPLYER